MEFGRVGVWQGGYGPPAALDRAFVGEVEALGYGAFWFGEAPGGKDAFVRAATLLAATSTMVLGTGIASIWGRDALNTASAIRTVGEAFPGRFVAGLGVSHAPLVEARGEAYWRPLGMMRDYLATIAASQHGSPPPMVRPPVLLAALRPRMLELASQAADGAHPYFVPVEHTVRARRIMGPTAILAPEVAVVLEADPVEARRLARTHTASFYLSATNYVENLRWLGYGDDDFAEGGSDRLVDALVAWGDEQRIADRVREHLDAGADHVCIQVVTETTPFATAPSGSGDALGVLRRLAPALTAL
jgi:probable F420-dependent oxidoreductase